MNQVQPVDRRTFLGQMFSAGALVLSSRVLPGRLIEAAEPVSGSWSPSVYLGIEKTGQVTIVTHRSEMGTGIRSVLPMVLADELDADWKQVKLQQAIGDPKYGSQNTDGSCSIRDFYDAMRTAGATARSMLEAAAASRWKVPASECQARNHQVIHAKTGKKLGYGDLTALAARQPVPKKEELRFKSSAECRYIGKDLPTVDRDDLCRGAGMFGIDARMPGMVYASIERSPVFGGKLRKVDDQQALKVRGVQQVVTLEAFKPPHAFQALGGVAVIADNTWAATQGRKELKIEWESGENVTFESEAYRKSLQETARKPQKVVRNVGDVDAEFSRASSIHEAEYYVPLLAHAPMEPPAAVAEFKDGKVLTWAATQNPQAVQEAVAGALGIDKKDVTCHVTLLGGGSSRNPTMSLRRPCCRRK